MTVEATLKWCKFKNTDTGICTSMREHASLVKTPFDLFLKMLKWWHGCHFVRGMMWMWCYWSKLYDCRCFLDRRNGSLYGSTGGRADGDLEVLDHNHPKNFPNFLLSCSFSGNKNLFFVLLVTKNFFDNDCLSRLHHTCTWSLWNGFNFESDIYIFALNWILLSGNNCLLI